LEALAREVGCDLHNDTNLAVEDIDGAIVTGYRNLLKAYSAERNRLSECKEQLASFQGLLAEIPEDFTYPGSVESFDQLLTRPTMIEETLNTTLEEDVDELLTVHQKACRIGNFVPLMEEAKNLLQESKRAIASLASHLATLENVVNAYRQGLLQDEQLQSLEKAYVALQSAMRLPILPALKMSDLETGSLKDAKQRIAARRQYLVESLDKELSGVKIGHGDWVKLVNDLENNLVPSVSQEVAGALVAKGLIRVTYRLGGGA
jgi:DNA repair exonuclease SbcCD ATPase subunit